MLIVHSELWKFAPKIAREYLCFQQVFIISIHFPTIPYASPFPHVFWFFASGKKYLGLLQVVSSWPVLDTPHRNKQRMSCLNHQTYRKTKDY